MKTELEQLWLDYRADTLDEAGDRRLATLLAQDPLAVEAVLGDLEVEALLRTNAVDETAFLRATRARLAAKGDTSRFVSVIRPQLASRSRSSRHTRRTSPQATARWWWGAAVATAAAALLFIFIAPGPQNPARQPDPSTVPQQTLTIGPATIALTANATYHIDDHGFVLESGGIVCTVEPQRGGFSLRTPIAEIAVLGTRFTVDTDAHVSSVRVEHGKVRVTRPTSENLILESGMRCRFTAQGPLIPQLTAPGCALLISKAQSGKSAASELAAILRRDGWRVLLRDDEDIETIPTDVDVIILLQSASSSKLETPSRSWDSIPVLCLDPSVNRWLGLSPSREDEYLHDPAGTIILAANEAAWSAGLSGTLRVQSDSAPLFWAEPQAGVQILATVAGHPDRSCILLRPREGSRPPRMFLGINPTASPSAEGWALLRAAAVWLVSEHRQQTR